MIRNMMPYIANTRPFMSLPFYSSTTVFFVTISNPITCSPYHAAVSQNGLAAAIAVSIRRFHCFDSVRRRSAAVQVHFQLHFTSATRSGLFLIQHLSSLSSFSFPFFLYSLQFGCQVDVVQPIEFFPTCFCRSDTTTHLPHQHQSTPWRHKQL